MNALLSHLTRLGNIQLNNEEYLKNSVLQSLILSHFAFIIGCKNN